MTKIAVDKALIEQVIEVLTDKCGGRCNAEYNPCHALEVVTTLRAELAEPAVEPEKLGSEWVPCMKLPVVVHVRKQRPGDQHVSTREGITPVKQDDLIMRGVSGEEYPIGRAIFEQTYTFNTSPPPPAGSSTKSMRGFKDHEIAALINRLRDIATEFHATQQLRQRISMEILPLFASPPPPAEVPLLTDAEIAEAGKLNVEGDRMLPYSFARAIEKAVRQKAGLK